MRDIAQTGRQTDGQCLIQTSTFQLFFSRVWQPEEPTRRPEPAEGRRSWRWTRWVLRRVVRSAEVLLRTRVHRSWRSELRKWEKSKSVRGRSAVGYCRWRDRRAEVHPIWRSASPERPTAEHRSDRMRMRWQPSWKRKRSQSVCGRETKSFESSVKAKQCFQTMFPNMHACTLA